MDNPRAEKVAVVNEVRERMEAADGAVLTEYRGLTVAELAELRRELAAAGGDYKVYKNTLVRLAVAGTPGEGVSDLLSGPTAIAFVHGDVSAVAKALREFSKALPHLVVKGGVVGTSVMSAADMEVLADLPSRETLLAQFAGALSAPLQQLDAGPQLQIEQGLLLVGSGWILQFFHAVHAAIQVRHHGVPNLGQIRRFPVGHQGQPDRGAVPGL